MSSLRSGCSLSRLSLLSSLCQTTILRNTLTSFRLLSEFAGSVLSCLSFFDFWRNFRAESLSKFVLCFNKTRVNFLIRANIRNPRRRLYLRRSFHTSCTNRMFSFGLSTGRFARLRKLRWFFRFFTFRKRPRLEFHLPRKLTLLHHVFDYVRR